MLLLVLALFATPLTAMLLARVDFWSQGQILTTLVSCMHHGHDLPDVQLSPLQACAVNVYLACPVILWDALVKRHTQGNDGWKKLLPFERVAYVEDAGRIVLVIDAVLGVWIVVAGVTVGAKVSDGGWGLVGVVMGHAVVHAVCFERVLRVWSYPVP